MADQVNTNKTSRRASSALVEMQSFAKEQSIPVILVCSITLLIQAGSMCSESHVCEKEVAYALCVGVISFFFTGVYWYLERYHVSSANKCAFPFSMCLFVWWGIGACVLTFDAPFTATGNGYFASWIGAVAATAFAYKSANAFHAQADQIAAAIAGQPVAGIFLASVVEMIAAIEVCSQRSYCGKEYGFSLSVGLISTLICIFMLLIPVFKLDVILPFTKFIALFLVLWWIPGVYINTFWGSNAGYFGAGIFAVTGNGYFSTWAALLLSVSFCSSQWEGGINLSLGSLASKKAGGASEGADLEAGAQPTAVAIPVATGKPVEPVTDEKPMEVANPGVASADDSASAI